MSHPRLHPPLQRVVQAGVLALLLFCLAAAATADPAAEFAAGNRLYEQGLYSEAAAAYQKLLATAGGDAPLHFNLGNALFKAGRVGEAILHYRIASTLAPRDPDIRANLQFARNSIAPGTTPPGGAWRSAIERLTLNEWTVLSTLAFWAWLILLTLPQWRPPLRPVLRGYTLAAGIATALLALTTAVAFQQSRRIRWAILIVPETVARYGPLAVSPTAYTVRDGAELRLTDREGDWIEVTDAAGRRGWIEAKSAALFP